MTNTVLDEDRVRELEEIGLSTVEEELRDDCLPDHLLDAARVWLKLKGRDSVAA